MKRILGVRENYKSLCQPEVDVVALFIWIGENNDNEWN